MKQFSLIFRLIQLRFLLFFLAIMNRILWKWSHDILWIFSRFLVHFTFCIPAFKNLLGDFQTYTHRRMQRCEQKGPPGALKRVGKGCRAHIKHWKGTQGAYKVPKKATGCCALSTYVTKTTFPFEILKFFPIHQT